MFVLDELFFSGYKEGFITILYITAVYCGIFVIISKNPIISVLFLIGLFLNIASYLMLLGINFIGLSYLLVYVGAVSILFLFILMLINVRISELTDNTTNSLPLAIIIAILFIYTIYDVFPYYKSYIDIHSKDFLSNNNDILYSSSKTWDSNLAEHSYIEGIGNVLYTTHFIWLLLTSLILLLAMVGTICLVIN